MTVNVGLPASVTVASPGPQGVPGAKGDTGATGAQGPQGNPTTVNGHTGTSINLTAADVAALATANNLSDVVSAATARHNLMPWLFDVAAYGAVGDGKIVTDGAMSTGSTTLTSATASFQAGDQNKIVMVPGAGVLGQTTLVTTIQTVNSSTSVTLAAANASGSPVSGARVMWATDDTAHIQAAINAALTYAAVHGSAVVFIPTGAGLYYGVGGALVTGGSTLGNSQLTLGAPVATTANKICLTIEGVGNGSGLEHWQQTVPTMGGSTLVSFGVFANPTAQATSINAAGNPCVIGGPSQANGYGTGTAVFSNMLVTLRNLSILTTPSTYGLTFSAADFSGVAEANLVDFAYGTAGTVAGGDYQFPASFANGLSVGLLLPAAGNNDNNRCSNVSCHGGYTFAIFATEHFTCDRLVLLYCWSGLCPVGSYYGSVGATHSISVQQASIEACSIVVNIIGVGSGGIGPWVFANVDTEIGTPVFADRTSGTGLAAALGTITLTGLYTPANVSVNAPTGLKIIDGQQGYPVKTVTSNYTVNVVDNTILVNAASGPITVTLISAAWTPNSYTVKKTDTSANAVTVAAQGGQTIDGVSTYTLGTPYQSVTVVPPGGNGGNWNVV